MKYLFLFAHPDDETVGCAGTIKQLTENGDEVVVVSVTDGGAGEVMPRAQAELKKFGSLGELRRQELAKACGLLGVTHWEILGFNDGGITNQMVWNELTDRCAALIDTYKPDVVVTFDHTGWYFHLDHVATSIATTLAVQRSHHPPRLFFHVHLRVNQNRWRYVFNQQAPITHQVDVSGYKELKLQAIEAHASQDLTTIVDHVNQGVRHHETYQLVSMTEEGQEWLEAQFLFVSTKLYKGSGSAPKVNL